MNLKIIPYCKIDGVRTFRDSFIMKLWEDAKDLTPFVSRIFKDEHHWLYVMKYECALYILELDGEVVGCSWLSHFQEKFAQVHYFYYRKWWGKTVEIGREALRQVLHWKDDEGYVFEGLLGFTEEKNSLGIRLAKKCGWKPVGSLPFAYRGEKPGVIMYITRKELGS